MKREDMREICGRLGWKQKDLAERLGVSSDTIGRWDELPGPAAAYLRLVDRIAGVLDV